MHLEIVETGGEAVTLSSEQWNHGIQKSGVALDSSGSSLTILADWDLSVSAVRTTPSEWNGRALCSSLIPCRLVLDGVADVSRPRLRSWLPLPWLDHILFLYGYPYRFTRSGWITDWCAKFSPMQNCLVRIGTTRAQETSEPRPEQQKLGNHALGM